MRQDQVEEQLQAFLARLSWPPKPIHDWAVAALRANRTYAAELEELSREQLTRRYEQLHRQLKRLYLDRLDGRIPVEQYDEYAKPIIQEQEQIKRRLALIHPDDEAAPPDATFGRRLADVYQTSTVEGRRGLLGWLFAELRLGLDQVLAAAYSPVGRLMAGLEGSSDVGYLAARPPRPPMTSYWTSSIVRRWAGSSTR